MGSPLLVHPTLGDPDGIVQRITPQTAGWRHVGFEVVDLRPGQVLARDGTADELCLVLVTGRARIWAGDRDLGLLGGRTSPFEDAPWSAYLPPRLGWRVEAEGAVELAVCAAPATGRLPPRVIGPDAVGTLTRGTGTNARLVRNILPDTAAAESLLVVEVVTPGGHWSSYPPHKHDTDGPDETCLEETYYHRLRRGAGFAVQRVYTPDRSLDETMAVGDRDVVLVPRGYHPVGAPHGFDLYYLNVMAGPVRQWRFTMDPDHAHLPY